MPNNQRGPYHQHDHRDWVYKWGKSDWFDRWFVDIITLMASDHNARVRAVVIAVIVLAVLVLLLSVVPSSLRDTILIGMALVFGVLLGFLVARLR